MEPHQTRSTNAAAGTAAARSGYGTSTSLGRQQFSVDHNLATIMADSVRERNAFNSNVNSNANSNANSPPANKVPARAVGLDLLRGLLMVIMAMDHSVISINSWPHGQGQLSELDGVPITHWNRPIGYAVRLMTHLCAPGFFFLLGMGIVYFGRSRSRLGWSAFAMARHFVIRAAVLTSLTVLMGLAVGLGKLWFLNMVLFALGIDYLILGLLWLLFTRTEPALAELVVKAGRVAWGETEDQDATEDDGDEEEDAIRRPLLSALQRSGGTVWNNDPKKTPGAQTSWHIHNLVLLVLVGVTIWWNIWLSPNGGRCVSTNTDHSPGTDPIFNSGTSFLDFWFHAYATEHVISAFPPMGWLSFAIAGLLYARLVLHPSATFTRIRIGTLVSSLVLAVVFVLTRLLHFGNLTEDCLFTPDQGTPGSGHSGRNQYLASPQAFFYLAKYPPDVAFFAYTLSVNLILLFILGFVPRKFLPMTIGQVSDSNSADDINIAQRVFGKVFTGLLTVLLTFGNSALFFYVIHQCFAFAIGSVLVRFFGREIPGEKNPLDGSVLMGIQSVWAFWGLWLLVLLIMFPLCRWYARFKGTKGVDSVWRFF